MTRGPALTALAAASFIVFVVGAAGVVACHAGLCTDVPRVALALLSLGLQFIPVALLAMPTVVAWLRRFLDDRTWRIVFVAAALLSPYLLYWAIPGEAQPARLLRLIAWVAMPTFVASFWPRRWALAGDALIILLIWLPVEFHWVRGAYPWPSGGGGSILAAPLGLGLMVFLMVVVRGNDDIGYVARVDRRDLSTAFLAFAAFALVGIPIGFLSGFLRPAHVWPGLLAVLVRGAVIFFVTALPEETCFRGLIQGFFQRLIRRPAAALAMASLVFGAAHLNNGPAPDWRYFLLATLAGIAYGWAYQRTRRLAAPTLTHLLVDLTWSIAFKG